MSNTLTKEQAVLVMAHLQSAGVQFEVGPSLCIKRKLIEGIYHYAWGLSDDTDSTIGPVFYDLQHEQETHEVLHAINDEF